MTHAAQTDDWDDFVATLKDEPIPVRCTTHAQTFPCGQCAGSGLWKGGVTNSHGNRKCNPCKGRGYFTTSPEKRMKASNSAAARKEAQREDARSHNAEIEGGHLLPALTAMASWNGFALSLVQQHARGKMWTDSQAVAAMNMCAKVHEQKQARETKQAEQHVTVDLQRIRDMFETAVASGHRKPVYRAEGLIINRAPSNGTNPGALYVKAADTKDYLGKVMGVTFMPTRNGGDAHTALALIAADPMAAAVRYGQRTGVCACCGRKLTNADSVTLGIGPICKTKWGL